MPRLRPDPMTMKEAFLFGEGRLSALGIRESRINAWYLLEHVTGVSRAAYYAEPDAPLTAKEAKKYETLIEKRGKHIPLQHLTGVQCFMGLNFRVNENVLIPRQDTETLVEEALSLLAKCPKISGKIKALDIGTGSGCVILSIISHAARKGINVEGTATDISEKALDTAAANARDLGVAANFLKSDLFENIEGRFGLIVCNPPYIKTGEIKTLMEEVRLFEPAGALDGRADGLYFYRKIIPEAGRYLEDGGALLFESGYGQTGSIEKLMAEAGYRDIWVKKDLAGHNRVVGGIYRTGARV